MEISNHIMFETKECPKLFEFLKNNNIEFEFDDSFVDFNIFESHPLFSDIKKYVLKYDLFCISETIFSKKELLEAEWLKVRSCWRFDYPQPEDDFKYLDVTYSKENFCNKCGIGLKQIDSFRIKKAPKWGNKHLLMLNWVEDEFFVDDLAKNLFKKEFPFLRFLEVKNKKGTNILEGIYQMIIPQLENNGILENQDFLQNVYTCANCKHKKYHPSGRGMLIYKRETFNNATDIVKTKEYFGWEYGASNNIIINQRVYKFILENSLERGLDFVPVKLV